MNPKVLSVIPARLGSSRFPSKVLYQYRGKPLLYYIWREVSKCKEVDRVVIATDNRQIIKESQNFNADAVLTKSRLKTGSDRVAEIDSPSLTICQSAVVKQLQESIPNVWLRLFDFIE